MRARLAFSVLAALLHGTGAMGVSQILRRGTKEWNHGTFAARRLYAEGGRDVGHGPTF